MHRLLTGPLSVEQVTVAIADLPDALQGVRLTHLSDFHFDGVRLSESLLKRAINASNQANPDLVMLTGDFVTSAPERIQRLVPWLAQLQSRYGVYAVLGNHDLCYRRSRSVVTSALKQAGIRVLWNEIAYPLGHALPLVGLADYWSAEFDPTGVMAQLSPQVPRIVLSHNPDTAEVLQRWRVDLQLSGHTHGGQVVIPWLKRPLSLYLARWYCKLPAPLKRRSHVMKECYTVSRHWEWAEGLHRLGSNQLYTNRGLGTYLPGRLFCPPEVTVLTLEPAKMPGSWRADYPSQTVHAGVVGAVSLD